MYRKYVLALMFQCLSLGIFAQEALQGVVVSEDSKGKIEAVPFANVYWLGTNYGTSTDTNGVFQLAIPEKGANKLIVSFVGYQSDTLMVNDFEKSITISLKKSVELKAVDVDYRRKTTELSFINPIKMEEIGERELFKAACCNLSESFETNPSVDVNFTDAVTGARQIRMLGLDGPYTMISRENMPGIRGLGNTFGLSFIPGAWLSSIQVTKGVGPVINGYESIAGQINTELKKPEEGEQLFFNAFGNQAGRTELNLIYTKQLSKHWGTTWLLHGNMRPLEKDNNKDGFMDFPKQDQINLMNRWKFDYHNGWMGQIGVHYVKDQKEGGQTTDFVEGQERSNRNYIPYRLEIETEKFEVFTKTGYVFPKYKYRSIGLQMSANYYDQKSFFGIRNYNATQRSGYANLIYQSIIGTTFHKFKGGLSYLYDNFDEKLDSLTFDRIERVPGAFFEYTYEPSNNITLVAGLRVDDHNLFGTFISPRLHFRWAATENTVFRILGGSGQRTANIFADRQSLLATSRNLIVLENSNLPYGLQAEKAWNYGINLTRNFKLDYREGYVTLDLYRTDFTQQVVVDLDESARDAFFYNLDGNSYSNSAQIELNYELIKFLDMRVAYRWIEVRTEYKSGERQKPLTPKHRLFANFGYETQENSKGSNWAVDFTAQWLGEQRIPATTDNTPANQRGTSSPSFMLFNAQLSRNFSKRFSVYVGVENIFNYQQDDPIIAADNPFGNNFDASLVWGPIFGRMVYGGLRYTLKKEESK